MKPELIDSKCIHCGNPRSRDWSDIQDGAIICDRCPIFRYPLDPSWRYPDLVCETEIEPEIWVRTIALDHITKYGYCYHTFAIDSRTSLMKEVDRYKTRLDAKENHFKCVKFVISMRQRRRSASS